MRAELKSKIQNQKPETVLLLICAVAFALRLGPLFDNRFHPDEALFSTWALRIARGENLLLTGVPVDKPPLLIYFTALSFFIFGQSELAARVPNLIASVVSVVLVWRLGLSQLKTGKLGTGKLVIGKLVNWYRCCETNRPFGPGPRCIDDALHFFVLSGVTRGSPDFRPVVVRR